MALLSFTAVGLRLFGYRRVYRLLNRGQPVYISPGEEIQEARRLAQGVQRAAERLPYASCLPRSLTIWCLLHRRGIAADIHLGVKKEHGEFKAHAWVQYDQIILSDRKDVRHRFAPFEDPLK